MDLINQKLGPYQINREIGRGGMAIIYHATDTRTGEVAAIKVLLPHLAHEIPTRRRFQQEGENAKRLIHPNIVRVFEAGESAGTYYIAMEYVPGGTVADRLKARNQPLTVDEALPILYQIAAALDYAHARNILHRDIKPSNLLLGEQRQALLSDFGIARPLTADYTVVTLTGLSVGTPAYMSPEQATGDKNLTAQSDIYSLGVVAYNMLTLALPFDADTPLVLLRKIVDDRPVLPEQVNGAIKSGVSYAIQRVLSKSPERRYATATEFIYALEHGRSWFPAAEDWALLSQSVPLVAAPYDRTEQPRRTPSRPVATVTPLPPARAKSRQASWIIASLGLLLVTFAGYALYTAGILPGLVRSPSSTTPATTNAPLVAPRPPTILRTLRDENNGFEVDIPTGWTRTSQGNAIFFEEPNSAAWVMVERRAPALSAPAGLEEYLADTPLFRAIVIQPGDETAQETASDADATQEIEAALLGGTQFRVQLRAINRETDLFIIGFGVKPALRTDFAETRTAILSSFVLMPLEVAAGPTLPITTTIEADTTTQTITATAVVTSADKPTTTVPAVSSTATRTQTSTIAPTNTTTTSPTRVPAIVPTTTPTATPIPTQTELPTPTATATPKPTDRPTLSPTLIPTETTQRTATVRPTNTPRPTATRQPTTSTPKPTVTPRLATATPIPPTATLQPTATPLPPTSTPLPPATPLPPTPAPPPTAAPLPPTLAPPTATPVPPTATSATADFAGAAVTLVEPGDGDTLNSRRTFSWQATFNLPAGYAFEPVFWRQGGTAMDNGRGFVGTTTTTSSELQPNQFLDGSGEYIWGILLVTTDPYTRIKYLGSERRIYVETGSDSPDNGNDRPDPSSTRDDG